MLKPKTRPTEVTVESHIAAIVSAAMSRANQVISMGLCALVIFAVCVCGPSGCGDEESGHHPGIIDTGGAGTPDQAWLLIEQSLNRFDVDGWERSVAATFEYVPDPVSAAEFPNAFTDWDREVELAFARALFASGVELDADLVVNGSGCPQPSGSSVIWPNVEYSVVLSDSGTNPITYRGFADLEFRLDGGFWYLSRWVDLRGAPAPWNEGLICPTIGQLRGAIGRGRSAGS